MDAARKAKIHQLVANREAATAEPGIPPAVENALRSILATNTAAGTRAEMLRKLFDPRRDLDAECGYPKCVTEIEYRVMYDREMGRRVVNVYPEESWKIFPEIYETEDAEETQFEKDFLAFEQQHHLLHYLQRVDELSGIGHYGLLLWGLDDGKKLNEPVAGCETWAEATGGAGTTTQVKANKRRVLFIRAIDESLLSVASFETNVANPRYGLPVTYNITLADPQRQGMSTQNPPDLTQMVVHWSRVTHIADNRKTSEVFGTPRQEPVWNRLLDLRKVLGGSGEMFWRGGFPGVSLETHPQETNAVIDTDGVRRQMYDYMNGLQRYLALSGMTAKSLSPQIAEPTSGFEVHVKAICVTLGVPYRVFMGIEEGVVSGDQATKAWLGRMATRQARYITPMIINPVIQRLIDYGVLTAPAVPGEWKVDWPNLMEATALEKAEIGLKRTEAIAKYVSAGCDVLFPPLEYLTTVVGMTDDEAQAVVDASVEHIEAGEEEGAVVPGRTPKLPEAEKPDVILKPGDKLVPAGKPARGNPKPTANFNPNHGADGKFSSGAGGGSGAMISRPAHFGSVGSAAGLKATAAHHKTLADHFTSKGDKVMAAKHEGVAAKYTKKAERQVKKEAKG